MWPKKVWEPGRIASSGKQLWYSRIVTKDDRVRRQEYEDHYREREEKRAES